MGIESIDDLVPDDHNANRGTVRGRELLEASLRAAGAGRSVLADRNGKLIAGNKTTAAAKALNLPVRVVETNGRELVVVQRTDLDLDRDAAARELAYYDNRAGEVSLDWNIDQLQADFAQGVPLNDMFTARELELLFDIRDMEREVTSFEDVPHELDGAAALKADMTFESDGPYNIPALLPERLGSLPDAPIDVWAGPSASDSAWPGWWFYNYGSDSVQGMDWTRTIMGFYVDDVRFERWYNEPDVYAARAINAQVPLLLSPNFSLWSGQPAAVHIFNVFRSRWVARYLQEAGLMIIPDIHWASEESLSYILAGIPAGLPCIAMQIQTLYNAQVARKERHAIRTVMDTLRPEAVLLYGGGKDVRVVVESVIPPSVRTVAIESRVTRRHDRTMGKDNAPNRT